MSPWNILLHALKEKAPSDRGFWRSLPQAAAAVIKGFWTRLEWGLFGAVGVLAVILLLLAAASLLRPETGPARRFAGYLLLFFTVLAFMVGSGLALTSFFFGWPLELRPAIPPKPAPIGKPCAPSKELCNGTDDDCDGQVDEGTMRRFYRDQDGDSFGDPKSSLLACGRPRGYVENDNDCCDQDKEAKPGQTSFGPNEPLRFV
ncbi:MAG: hypothetical protein R3F43_24405 [bacterium]